MPPGYQGACVDRGDFASKLNMNVVMIVKMAMIMIVPRVVGLSLQF